MKARLKNDISANFIQYNTNNMNCIKIFLEKNNCYDISTTNLKELEFRYDDSYTDTIVYTVQEDQYIVSLLGRIFIFDQYEFKDKFTIVKLMERSKRYGGSREI